MAKLSWLDRQLENQLENERQKKENQVLELQLHAEQRKHEDYMTNCSKMRETELSQIKTIQEGHVQELKHRDREIHDLKLTENTLRKKLDEIKKEISNMNAVNSKRRDRIQALHNYRKIKMMLRERSETVRRHLQQDLNLLDRLRFDPEFDNNEEINFLKMKIQGQFDKEIENSRYIETMYESEAKESMRKQNEKWDDESMVRERQLQLLMEDRHQVINDRINECVHRQREIEKLRDIHVNSIEDCNHKLKDLMDVSMSRGLREASEKPFYNSTNQLDGMIKKTNDLIINDSGISSQLCLPKYGRKKVAWT
jgi:trichoplein keratin filament-binding protein